MANIFTITTVAQTLKADVNGSATAAFTVTNSTSRPLRGIARIKPLGNTESSWIKIDGETERDFPPGGTHQYTVNFNKPKPATPPTTPQPAESFPFRFDEVSATNPQEDFSEGPVVTVEIPVPPVPPPPPKWWILILVGILLVVSLIVGYLVFGRNGDDAPIPTPTPTITPTATPTPAPTPIRSPTPPRMSAKEFGFDRPGSDFNKFITPTVEGCENACRETGACQAYTWGNGNNCWLKNTQPPKVKNPLYTSGIKIRIIRPGMEVFDQKLLEQKK
jgi:hypothetical protein